MLKLLDFLNDYCAHGSMLHIRVPVEAGSQKFEMTLCRDDRIREWTEEYCTWLEALDLEVDSVFGNENGMIITTSALPIIQKTESSETGCTQSKGLDTRELDIEGITLLTKGEAESLSSGIRNKGYRWWLKTRGEKDNTAYCVSPTGVVGTLCVDYKLGVRPVLKIFNLSELGLSVGDVFDHAGYSWRVILPDKALCEETIGVCYFNEDRNGHKSRNYANSDIRAFTEKWYRSQLKRESRKDAVEDVYKEEVQC